MEVTTVSDSIGESPIQVSPSPPVIQDVSLEESTSLDASILNLSVSKDQLRTLALQRLGELRGQLARVQNELESTNREKMIFVTRWKEEVDSARDNALVYHDVLAELKEQITMLGRNNQNEESQRNNREEIQTPRPTNQSPTHPFQPVIQSSHKKIPEPEKFNGTDRPQSIDYFLVALERFFRLSKTNQSEKIDMAAGFLSGKALEWWTSVERTEGERIRSIDWEEFRQMCLKRFMPVTNAETALKKIGKWRQSGNISSYISSFQNLAQQIPLTLLPKDARLLYFIDGLTIDLQKHVKAMRPESIEDAISFAQSIGNVGYTQGGMNINSRVNLPYSHSQRQTQQQSHNHSVGTRNQPIYLENVNTDVREVDSSVDVSSPSQHMRVTSPDLQSTSFTGVDLSFLTAEQRKLFSEGRCFKCKQIGHRRSTCPNNQRFYGEKKY